MTAKDENFLREYQFFTVNHFSTIAKLAVDRMSDIRDAIQCASPSENISLGDELGHLLAHVHVLVYMQAETTSALLFGLANRDNGIVSSMLKLKFGSKKHISFLNNLESIEDLGIHIPENDLNTEANRLFKKHMCELVSILGNDDLRNSYNKLKHCGIVVRDAEMLSTDDNQKSFIAHAVFIPTAKSNTDMYAPHCLSSDMDKDGVYPEEKCLRSISFFSDFSKTIARNCESMIAMSPAISDK